MVIDLDTKFLELKPTKRADVAMERELISRNNTTKIVEQEEVN